MASPIQVLHKLCKSTFRRLLPEDSSCFTELKHHLNKITATDVGFDPIAYRENEMKRSKAPVSYTELYQNRDSHTMAIFIVKQGCSLPLHDHPGMSGLLKVIHGKVRLSSYTEIEFQPVPQHMAISKQTCLVSKKIKTVIKHPDMILSDSDECCVLCPNEGNIHEIHPLTEFAAFIDILVPPYGEKGCHYYQELVDQTPSLNNHKWLIEIGEPDSYYCDVLPYRGPKLSFHDD